MAMTADGKNQIMIYGPKRDGTYLVDSTAAREARTISIPQGETADALRAFPAGRYGAMTQEGPRAHHQGRGGGRSRIW
jgi:hypothetical protein